MVTKSEQRPVGTGPYLKVLDGGKEDTAGPDWSAKARTDGTSGSGSGGGGNVDGRIGKLEGDVGRLKTDLKDYRDEHRTVSAILIVIFLGLFGLIYTGLDSTKDRLADGLRDIRGEIAATNVTLAEIQGSQNGLIARFDQFLARPTVSDELEENPETSEDDSP